MIPTVLIVLGNLLCAAGFAWKLGERSGRKSEGERWRRVVEAKNLEREEADRERRLADGQGAKESGGGSP